MLRPMSGSTRPTAGVGNGSGVGVVVGDSVGVGEGVGVAVAFGGVGATVTFVRFGVGVRVGVACGIGVDVGLSVGEGVGDSANVGDGGATGVGETSLVQPLPTTSRTEAVAAVSNKRSGDLPKMVDPSFTGIVRPAMPSARYWVALSTSILFGQTCLVVRGGHWEDSGRSRVCGPVSSISTAWA